MRKLTRARGLPGGLPVTGRVERDVVVDELAEVGVSGRDPGVFGRRVLAPFHQIGECVDHRVVDLPLRGAEHVAVAGPGRLALKPAPLAERHGLSVPRAALAGRRGRYSMSFTCCHVVTENCGRKEISHPTTSAGPFLKPSEGKLACQSWAGASTGPSAIWLGPSPRRALLHQRDAHRVGQRQILRRLPHDLDGPVHERDAG